ncbi:conserved hypothetical protein [Pediculus humanus corporis]|uniref:Serine/threonine-protein phosphatase CPPED1 n=1 Tax=Pediculus humanus subsp. corporis TaxID=121224 RepID=E0VKC5_PEDHC|nr:uncharacterized protein Phum_PHUM259880 [Pediculus humanus corporis]EEB13831.1 conserved hypothetical protein [Pediculus humanus corporis]
MNLNNYFVEGKQYKYFNEEKEKQWKEPFYFIQGADTQFGFIARELDNNKIVTWEKEIELTENVIKRVNKMRPKPKFFVMCGDLCDEMPNNDFLLRKKQESDFKKVFQKLDKDIPLVCVCGNHDVGNSPTRETMKLYNSSFGDDYYYFWCGGILFLVINSQYFVDSAHVPDLAEKQEKWIEEKLKEANKKRIIVFQHVPWFLKKFDEEDQYFNINSSVRRKWLKKFKKAGVKAIFCGHYHRNGGGIYDNIDVAVTSAVGGQLGNDKSEKTGDDIVTELENLKGFLDKTSKTNNDDISVSKSLTSFFVNKNEVVAKIQQKVNTISDVNGKPKSVSKTELEIPSKGIHNVIIKDDENENGMDGKEKIVGKTEGKSGLEYSPLDMAEYIYWTGDEKNVALMIEELLEEGLMSRQEAINFLQSIKFNLDFMQARDKNLQKLKKKISYVEYLLEEIIYKLAKIMFSQSITVKNTDAQKSLHKLVNFLEKEVKKGEISRNLERKLLGNQK